MTSHKVEEYLEAIYKLQEVGSVHQSILAKHLNLKPASVAEMLKRWSNINSLNEKAIYPFA